MSIVKRIAYAISLSILAVPVVPVYAWWITQNSLYMYILPYSFVFAIFVKFLKTKNTWSLRPVSACDCNILGNNGPVGGEPGFPSGHMAFTTVILMSTALHLDDPVLYTIVAGWIVGMAWSRIVTGCHDKIQVFGGLAIGGIASMLYVMFE
jgi:membrane-associated phospholipid phosphatase